MNVLSLFGGIECGRVALDRAGIKPARYFSSEVDKYAMMVSTAKHPDIIHIGDVRGVFAKNLPKIDLLIGGSPCQGFSFAGKMLNFDDPRSALFFEFVRIFKECREINPDVLFMLENVLMKKECEKVITDALGVHPIMINAAKVSAQNRRRLFWTNIKAEPINLFGELRSTMPQPKDKKIMLSEILQHDASEKYFLSKKAMERIAGSNIRSTSDGFHAFRNDKKSLQFKVPMSQKRAVRFIVLERGISLWVRLITTEP